MLVLPAHRPRGRPRLPASAAHAPAPAPSPMSVAAIVMPPAPAPAAVGAPHQVPELYLDFLFKPNFASEAQLPNLVDAIASDFGESPIAKALLQEALDFPFQGYVTTMGRLELALRDAIGDAIGCRGIPPLHQLNPREIARVFYTLGAPEALVQDFERLCADRAKFSVIDLDPLLGGLVDPRVCIFVLVIEIIYERISHSGHRRKAWKLDSFCCIVARVGLSVYCWAASFVACQCSA